MLATGEKVVMRVGKGEQGTNIYVEDKGKGMDGEHVKSA